jgi:hypothetical protein
MNEIISLKLNREDKDFLKNEARKMRLTLSSYVRYKVLAESQK